MMTDATVHVLDDDPAVRDSLGRLIESVDLCAQLHSTPEEFLAGVDPRRPSCLVLDIRLRGMSGLELQNKLQLEHICIPVIVITGYGDVSTAVRAMRAGALDFIEKPVQPQVLLDRIHQALEQDREWKDRHRDLEAVGKRLNLLSRRERQVLDQVVQGKLTKQIALDLDLKSKTIDAHRGRMMKKMQAGTVADLVRMVVTAKMLERQEKQISAT